MKRFFWAIALTTLALPQSVFAAESFQNWLADFKKEAISKGISEQTVNQAFTGVKPIPRIIELDRKQPEGTMTWSRYKKMMVSESRLSAGEDFINELF